MKDVNTTDIADAVRLGCRTMQNVFNADDNGVPFFATVVRPEAWMKFSSAFFCAETPLPPWTTWEPT